MTASSPTSSTPVAAIRALIEALVDGLADDPATKVRYLEAVQHETTHLSELVDDAARWLKLK